jgi:YVTN family beta-propeller protein
VPITNPAATVNIGSAPIVPTATPWPTITVTPTPRPPTPTPIIGPPPTGKEYAYVANSKSGTVSIVDTSTDTVVGTIRVSDNPSGVVATPGGTYILVAGWNPNYVSVYNTLTHALVKTIAAGDVSPKYIDISADGEWAFALGKKGDYFYVQTIDMKTLTMTASVNITTTAGTHIEASDHGEYAIIACGDRIVRYNRVTGGVDECVIAPFIVYGMSEVGQNYNLFIIAGNGTLQYSPVTNSISEEHNFTYYDTPRSVAANVNEQKLYLVYFNTSYNVTKVDYWTGAIDWNVTLASPGYFMDTGADGVYVAESYNNTVVHIASNGTVLGYISVGAWPLDINIGNIIGVDSSMQYVTFTTRTLGDLLTVSQVNLTIYDNSNRLLYGTSTDDAGTATFYMSGVQQYRIHVNQSPNVDFDYNVMPSQTGYVIRISSADVAGNIFGWTSDTGTNAPETPGQPSGSAYTWSTSYNPEDGSADITVTYSRAAASVLFNLYRNATEFGGEDVLDDTATVNTPPFTHTFHIADATGRGYYVIMTVTGTPTGTTVISQGLAKVFPGPRVLTGVLPDDWFFWLGWGTILLLLTAGTVTKKGLFGVFGAVLGSIFTNWGWFSLVLNIDAVWYAIVGFCFIVSIGMMLGERERYT